MKEDRSGAEPTAPSAARPLWVYGYRMDPPQGEDRMAAIRDLLDRENDEAARQGRKWTGCLVTDEKASHILIVTSSPDVDLHINRRVGSELRAMGIRFELSVPMLV